MKGGFGDEALAAADSGSRITSSEAADEAPLLQPADQAMNARFGLETQGIPHFVEGRRNAIVLQALVDIEQ
jgi:hypothetical protein